MDNTDLYLNIARPEELLAERGSSYSPADYIYPMVMGRARPIFNYQIIEEMVMDPRVMFGLLLIKGPIVANTRFGVKAESQEVQDFVIAQINRFWNRCINKVLEGVEWGFSSSEVLYERSSDGDIVLKGMNTFKSMDVKIIAKKGVRTGVCIDNIRQYGYTMEKVYLGGPKHFHYVHWRKYDKHHGRSRLYSTLIPFWEMWAKGGYRDIRRMWFGKNAFQSGTVRYPKGVTNVPGRGNVDNHVLALEMATKMMTGAATVAPSSRSGMLKEGEWDWMFEPVKANSIPAGLLEYGGLLRVEILESMGIPYEVVEASGNEGFGSSSGRSIPLVMYNAMLFEIIQDVITDFRDQILDTLVYLKFGEKMNYEVTPIPLQTPEQSQNDPSTSEKDDEQQSGNVDGKRKQSTKKDESIDEQDSDEETNDDREGVARAM